MGTSLSEIPLYLARYGEQAEESTMAFPQASCRKPHQ